MSHETLTTLHTRTVDARAGFDKMVEKAEAGFLPDVRRFQTLHADHETRLVSMLAMAGVAPGDDSSFMSTVNQAAVTLRSWVGDIDGDVMKQVQDGEDHVIEAFDDAIHDQNNAAFSDDLRTMKAELTTLLADTRPLD